MPSAADARRARRTPRQVGRAGSGTAATDERADAEADEREERQRRSALLDRTSGAGPGGSSGGGGGSRGGGGGDGPRADGAHGTDGAAALRSFARRGASSASAEVAALLDSGDLDHTVVLGGRTAALLREERAASQRLGSQQAEIAKLERTIGLQLVPEELRGRDAAWDPQRPQQWLERYAGGEGTELVEARRRLAELRSLAAEERQRVERMRPEADARREEALRRARGEDIEVLLMATRRLREHGGEEDAAAAEHALSVAREQHARETGEVERELTALDGERDRLRADLGHSGSGGVVAAHVAEEERLQRTLDEAAAPLAAVRGRMAELLMERDPRARRRDRRLYARGSAKDLLEGALVRGHELRDAGGRAAETVAKRTQGRTKELLAGGLSRVRSLTDGPRPGLARRLIGAEGPERRRRADPETDGRSRRLPRRLRAQEHRMARAYERAASAYARHMARAPQAALFEQLASVEEHIHRGRLRLSSADAALLDRLTEVRSGLRSATAGLSGEPTAR